VGALRLHLSRPSLAAATDFHQHVLLCSRFWPRDQRPGGTIRLLRDRKAGLVSIGEDGPVQMALEDLAMAFAPCSSTDRPCLPCRTRTPDGPRLVAGAMAFFLFLLPLDRDGIRINAVTICAGRPGTSTARPKGFRSGRLRRAGATATTPLATLAAGDPRARVAGEGRAESRAGLAGEGDRGPRGIDL